MDNKVEIIKCPTCGEFDSCEPIYETGIYQCKVCGSKFSTFFANTEIKELLDDAENAIGRYEFKEADSKFQLIMDKKRELQSNNFNNEDIGKIMARCAYGRLLAQFGIVYINDFNVKKRIPTITRWFPKKNIETTYYYKELKNNHYGSTYIEKLKEISKEYENIKKELKEDLVYDVFICTKISKKTNDNPNEEGNTIDSEEAEKFYDELSKKGLKVFYSPKSLNGIKYDSQIISALIRSKKILVISSCKQYLESQWVRSEWSRWLHFIEVGEKEKSSLFFYMINGNNNDFDLPIALEDKNIQKSTSFELIISQIINQNNEENKRTNEEMYQEALSKQTNEEYEKAIPLFSKLGNYIDSNKRLKQCEIEFKKQKHKKRIGKFLILAILLIMIGGGGFVAYYNFHTHNYNDYIVNPTCTTEGYTEHICNICSDTYKDNYIEALGHNYSEWIVIDKATEEKTGLKERECLRCGNKVQEKISMLDHTHKFIEKIINPTCEEKGYTEYTCECGDSYKDNYIEALGHSYSEWVIIDKATETTVGLKEKECSRCKNKIQEKISILDHTHKYKETIIDPTCTIKGYTEHICECGDSYKDNYTNALGHTEVILPKVDATCTTSGLTVGKKCSVCETILVKQEEIKAKGHTEEILPKVEATCTKTGLTIGKKCSVCETILVKQEEIKAKGHIETDWIIDGEATCTENGSKHIECSECKESLKTEIVTLLGHNYIETITNPTCTTQGNTTFKCSRCSDTYKDNYTNALGHTEVILPKVEATCTKTGLTIGKKCSVCEIILVKQEEINALGHNYSEWKVVKEATEIDTGLKEKECSRCNDKQTEIIPILTHEHSYIEEVISPTCVDKGYTLHTCKCGDSYIDNYTNALGHIETDWIIDSVSTCTSNGSQHKECSICNEILKTEIITSPSHNYVEKIIAPTCTNQGYTIYQCSSCGDSYKGNYTSALGHTVITIIGYDATCTTTGLTDGKKCSKCNIILVEQQVIKAKGHTESDWIIDNEATCIENGSKHKKCTNCNKELEQETILALGHNYSNYICTNCKCVQIFNNKYIYFGLYPQTLKEDSVTIISTTTDSNGYYTGSDGEKYAKVTASPINNAIQYDNNSVIVKGKAYYFKVEPIKWRIIQSGNGTYQLFSELILDTYYYVDYDEQKDTSDQLNKYSSSNIREYLNNTFFNKAFTNELQTYITTTVVDNSALSTGISNNSYACENTSDKIYLLSYKDIINSKYGFSDIYTDDSARCKLVSDFAKAKGCYMDLTISKYGLYWLRSPASTQSYYVNCVNVDGYLEIKDAWDMAGVVPAMNIKF